MKLISYINAHTQISNVHWHMSICNGHETDSIRLHVFKYVLLTILLKIDNTIQFIFILITFHVKTSIWKFHCFLFRLNCSIEMEIPRRKSSKWLQQRVSWCINLRDKTAHIWSVWCFVKIWRHSTHSLTFFFFPPTALLLSRLVCPWFCLAHFYIHLNIDLFRNYEK